MLCLRCSRGLSAFSKIPTGARITQNVTAKASSKRTFTSLTPLRPTIFPSALRSHAPAIPQSSTTAANESLLDLAILPFKMSTHPAMEAMQVRCAPRNTFNPSHFVRKRRHGFLARLKSRTGRMILKRRRAKKRSTLSH